MSCNKPLKWTVEAITAEALKYTVRRRFHEHAYGAYKAAKKLGILESVCSHMGQRSKWDSEEKILEVAAKFTSKNEFREGAPGVFQAAERLGLIDAACLHMTIKHKRWTLDELRLIALKYNSRVDFKRYNHAAYKAAIRFGYMDSVCAHMEARPSTFDRLKPATFYYIKITQPNAKALYKIGVTNNSVHIRYKDECVTYKIITQKHFNIGKDALIHEKKLLKQFERSKYLGDKIFSKTGNTELFTQDILGLDLAA